MNQINIGKFIAECRRKENLTQMQLAEKLNITDRAISKWENGKAMPDSSIMLKLCGILKISVNDLLCGRKVTMDNYNKELEENLLQVIKEKAESDKRLLTLEWVIGIFSVIILLIPTIVASYVTMEEWKRVVLVFSGLILCVVGLSFAIKIEQVAGYYECQKCSNRYVPDLKTVYLAMHIGRTRYMKCPKCNQKSWQKKVISKTKE